MSNYLMVPVKPVKADLLTELNQTIYVPLATKNTYGSVKIGDGLNVDNGIISFDESEVTILSISLNGEPLTIDEDKNVDIALTKNDVGLDQVDNTSDMDKPISTVQQAALNLKLDKRQSSANIGKVAYVNDNGDIDFKNVDTIEVKLNDEVIDTDAGIFNFSNNFTITSIDGGQVDIDLSEEFKESVGKIDSISLNGELLKIDENKNVDINLTDYYTKIEVDATIDPITANINNIINNTIQIKKESGSFWAGGSNTSGNPPYDIRIGNGALAKGYATAIGHLAEAGANSVSVGYKADSYSGYASVAIGWGSIASDTYGIAVGSGAHTRSAESIAIGGSVDRGAKGAIQLGLGENARPKTLQVYNYRLLDGNTGIIPDERLSFDPNSKVDRTELSSSVVERVYVSTDEVNVNLEQTLRNFSTGTGETWVEEFPLASDTSAGAMSATDYKSIRDLQARVGQLEQKTTRLLYDEKLYPTAEEINTFVTSLGYSVPFEGVAVVVSGTNHIWRYYEGGTGWKDDGVDVVSQFTNDIAGIIKGSASDGKVYAETDGTGSVYGWDALKNSVTNLSNQFTNYTPTSNLSAVALSGSYNDLTNKPTIPTLTSQLTNDSGFLTNESDPTIPDYVKSITETDITNWNDKLDSSYSSEYVSTAIKFIEGDSSSHADGLYIDSMYENDELTHPIRKAGLSIEPSTWTSSLTAQNLSDTNPIYCSITASANPSSGATMVVSNSLTNPTDMAQLLVNIDSAGFAVMSDDSFGGVSITKDTSGFNVILTGTAYLESVSDENKIATISDITAGILLYDTTGQNTDGAMTQKATTDALPQAVSFDLSPELNFDSISMTNEQFNLLLANPENVLIVNVVDDNDDTMTFSWIFHRSQYMKITTDEVTQELLTFNCDEATQAGSVAQVIQNLTFVRLSTSPDIVVMDYRIDFTSFATRSDLTDYVPKTRTINGKSLSNDIILTATDVNALPDTTEIPTALSDLTEDSTHRTVTDTEKSTWNAKVTDNNYVHTDNNYTNEEKLTLSELKDLLDNDGFGKVDDVKVNGTSVITEKVANISIGDLTFSSQEQYITDTNFTQDVVLHNIAKTGRYADLIGAPDVIDNLDSTSSTDVLSAKQGNELKKLINAIPRAQGYQSIEAMVTELNSLDSTVKTVGSNLLIQTLGVPDFWIFSIESTNVPYTYTTDEAFIEDVTTNGSVQVGYYKLAILETAKVDLSDYYTKEEIADLFSNYYTKTETNNLLSNYATNDQLSAVSNRVTALENDDTIVRTTDTLILNGGNSTVTTNSEG